MHSDNSQAIVALTAGGAELAVSLAEQTGAVIYLPARLESRFSTVGVHYFSDFTRCVEQLFGSYRQLIFIMAVGIVVRKIAPLLVSKQVDPAVVVMDEKANFAISLLSGHQGGANQLAQQMVAITGAVPVITTATDVRSKVAVDLLAAQLGCRIYPVKRVKLFNRLLVEGHTVYLYSQWPLPEKLYLSGLICRQWSGEEIVTPAVLVTNRLFPACCDTIKLCPRNLVVGVGCRRGIAAEEVIDAIKTIFTKYKLSLHSLGRIASVDLKKTENGLLEAAQYFKVPIEFVTRSEIDSIAGYYSESHIVKEKIGVGAVCEPSAIIISQRGKLLVEKQVMGRVTIAVAEQALWW